MEQIREIGRIAAISVTCKDCGKIFIMGQREANWYSNMGFPLPKRCKECRRARRKLENRRNYTAG